MNNTYFAFLDSTEQTINGVEYYGLGLLIIPSTEINELGYDFNKYINKNISKQREIKEYIWNKNHKNQNLKSLKKKFLKFEREELKYNYIRYHNYNIYKSLIKELGKKHNIFYTSIILKKTDYKEYISTLAMLISNSICRNFHKQFQNSKSEDFSLMIVCDNESLPKNHKKNFDKDLKYAIENYKKSIKERTDLTINDNFEIKAITHSPSHGFIFLQITDILIGLSLYGYKLQAIGRRKNGENEKARNKVFEELKKIYGINSIKNLTTYNPYYFSIWLFKNK